MERRSFMGELAELPNIGPEIERQLHQAGIMTGEELRKTGSKAAWLAIYGFDASACIHRLYGLEGAVRGIPKRQLDEKTKQDLKNFYREIKGT